MQDELTYEEAPIVFDETILTDLPELIYAATPEDVLNVELGDVGQYDWKEVNEPEAVERLKTSGRPCVILSTKIAFEGVSRG
ncbi:hypothetical protein IC617_03880 [Neiella sp. HB171785]|uniref:Uncharacterized protein n=1 Tax=Neiella litorisoli TaxID=2771431 RepID=A0A8J6QU43_9GAMM|nr:hypothetical protein [Neiella litorisoli]MBD1388558.1 hypothetical protein [Neiella litorisoli]